MPEDTDPASNVPEDTMRIPRPGPNGRGTPAERDVVLTHDQLVALMSDRAAGAAMDAVRARFNLAIGLLGAIFALIGGLAAIAFERSLDDIIDPKIASEVEGQVPAYLARAVPPAVETVLDRDLDGRLGEKLDLVLPPRIDDLARGIVQREMEARLAASSLIPLLVAESTSWLNQGGYSPERGDDVIDALVSLKPTMLALEGLNRELALRRIEDIVDAFIAAGDYYRTNRTYHVFGPVLFEYDGIVQSMGLALVSQRIIHGTVPQAWTAVVADFAAAAADPNLTGFEFQRLDALLAQVEAARWKEAAALKLTRTENERYPEFAEWAYSTLETLDDELAAGGQHHTSDGARRLAAMKSVMAQSMAAAQ